MLEPDRKWAISCYIPVFNFIFCMLVFVKKVESKFCLFHARQGLIVFGLWFITIMLGLFNQSLSLMMWGVVLVLSGAGMFIAYSGKEIKIPILGQLAMKVPEYYFYKILTGKSPELNQSQPPELPKDDQTAN